MGYIRDNDQYQEKIDISDKKRSKIWRDMAINLAKCLNRFVVDCHEMHHNPKEYHEFNQECPVVKEINKTLDEFNLLLSSKK